MTVISEFQSEDIAVARAVRHSLHRRPEVSGSERETARTVAAALEETRPDELLRDVGGHGVVAVYGHDTGGETVLLRAELDALPIEEAADVPVRSQRPGVAHLCGHDGHAAALLLVARRLVRRPVNRKRIVLLFQPAEETGQGAAAMVRDERLLRLRPDACFAWHNLPGEPLGHVVLRRGTICCGSLGLVARFAGTPAHAAYPESGSDLPVLVSRWLASLPQSIDGSFESTGRMASVCYLRAGEQAFGSTPAAAEVGVTLRAASPEALAQLRQSAEESARQLSAAAGVTVAFGYHDDFAATFNDDAAVDQVEQAAASAGLRVHHREHPFRWSEDFGRFREAWPDSRCCFLGIGAGETVAPLHDPRYRFPDELLPLAASLLLRVVSDRFAD